MAIRKRSIIAVSILGLMLVAILLVAFSPNLPFRRMILYELYDERPGSVHPITIVRYQSRWNDEVFVELLGPDGTVLFDGLEHDEFTIVESVHFSDMSGQHFISRQLTYKNGMRVGKSARTAGAKLGGGLIAGLRGELEILKGGKSLLEHAFVGSELDPAHRLVTTEDSLLEWK